MDTINAIPCPSIVNHPAITAQLQAHHQSSNAHHKQHAERCSLTTQKFQSNHKNPCPSITNSISELSQKISTTNSLALTILDQLYHFKMFIYNAQQSNSPPTSPALISAPTAHYDANPSYHNLTLPMAHIDAQAFNQY